MPTPTHSSTTTIDLHAWVTARGKCVGTVDAETTAADDPYFDETPPRGRYSPRTQARRAKAACDGCLAKKACLELALQLEADAGSSWGYWGGTAPAERQAILRDRDHNEQVLTAVSRHLIELVGQHVDLDANDHDTQHQLLLLGLVLAHLQAGQYLLPHVVLTRWARPHRPHLVAVRAS